MASDFVQVSLPSDNIVFREGRGQYIVKCMTIPTDFSGVQLTSAVSGVVTGVHSWYQGELQWYVDAKGRLCSADGTFRLGRNGAIIKSKSSELRNYGDEFGNIVEGSALTDGSVIAKKLSDSSKLATTTCVFSSPDYNTVAWTAGVLVLADGTSFSIQAGNTGDMTGMTYIYFDRAISQTQFQFAYSMTDIAYDDAILVCDAKQASSSDLLAHFVSINGYMLLNVNQLNVNFLSALSANMGTITAGSITSALYRSGTGTKRIEINYGIANEIEFFEDGISKVRIGSDVFGDGLPGVYAAGNIVATDVLATLMDLSVGDDNAYTGRIILNNATNGYTIVLTAPDTTDSTKTITLPNASGTVSLTSHNHSGVYLGIHGQADSALDSDALEGYPASSFAFASHNHSGVYHPYVAGGFSGSGAYMNFTFSNGVCTFAS